jgi:hypothetical protein
MENLKSKHFNLALLVVKHTALVSPGCKMLRYHKKTDKQQKQEEEFPKLRNERLVRVKPFGVW